MIVVTDDLEEAAHRLEAEHGVASVAGGRHEGHGTGNRIVPLGSDYVELMAVVDEDEARAGPLGRWVAERAAAGGGPSAVCLRTDDLDGVCRRLGLEPIPMTRERPDGGVVRWRLAGLEAALGPERLPFFIQWEVAEADHPARTPVDHGAAVDGIATVEVGGDPAAVAARLGEPVPGVDPVGGPPGVGRITLRRPDGEPVVL